MTYFEVLSPSPFPLDYLANIGIKSLIWINWKQKDLSQSRSRNGEARKEK